MKRALLMLPALWALTAATPFDPFAMARIEEHPGARIPLAAIVIESDGAHRSLAAIGAGKPVLLAPILHDCPNLCGVTLDGLATAMREAGVAGDRGAAVVAFSIDPKETPADARHAAARLARRHPETAGRVHAAVADERTIQAITGALGYHYAWDPRIGQYAHAAAVAVLTPDGRFARWLYGIAPDPADLRAALAEARAGRTGGWTRRLVLLCYHYDPETGRYSLAIDWLLRGLGMLTAVALLLYVVVARRRETRGKQ
jgi:protein SCO1/2